MVGHLQSDDCWSFKNISSENHIATAPSLYRGSYNEKLIENSGIMKLLCHAFDATLKKFGIKGIHISEDAEVSSGLVSNFRNDVHPITTDNLEKLLAALPDEAFTYWISQVAHRRNLDTFVQTPVDAMAFIQDLDDDATANLLSAIAVKLRNPAHNKQRTKALAKKA
jgi:hypothetical protein